jgi:hypothetical protein
MAFPRTLVALLAVASVAVGGLGSAAGTAGADSSDTYRAYAVIRQTMIGCSLDRTWHQMGSVKRRQCVRLRRLYVIWSQPGESGGYHLHCRTSKCPATPAEEPDARAPIPSGANVFR